MGGAGDLDGDGRMDVVWRNQPTPSITTGGENRVQLSAATDLWANYNLTPAGAAINTNANVKFKGVADFNNDGNDDILLYNESTLQANDTYVWIMDGADRSNSILVGQLNNLNWKLIGCGDVDGDGDPDVVWQRLGGSNPDRVVGVWNMNGTSQGGFSFIDEAATPNQLQANWKIAGIGDFTGTGTRADILWKNDSTSQLGVWRMGANWTSEAYVALTNLPSFPNPTNYDVQAVSSVNAQGKADKLLWRKLGDDVNANIAWGMNGTAWTSSIALPASPTSVAPTAPTTVTASAATDTQINLSWSGATNYTGFIVQRLRSGTATWQTLNGGQPVTQTSYADQTVSTGETYYYRVRAIGNGGASAWKTGATPTTATTKTITNVYPGDDLHSKIATSAANSIIRFMPGTYVVSQNSLVLNGDREYIGVTGLDGTPALLKGDNIRASDNPASGDSLAKATDESNIRVAGLTFENSGLVFWGASVDIANIVVENCTFKNIQAIGGYDGWGVRIVGSIAAGVAKVNNCQIRYNTFMDSDGEMIYLDDWHNTHVDNNKFMNVRQPIHLHQKKFREATGNTVRNNLIIGYWRAGIEIQDGGEGVLGGIPGNSYVGLEITGNYITGMDANSAYPYAMSVPAHLQRNTIIANNYVDGTPELSLEIVGRYVTIRNNKFAGGNNIGNTAVELTQVYGGVPEQIVEHISIYDNEFGGADPGTSLRTNNDHFAVWVKAHGTLSEQQARWDEYIFGTGSDVNLYSQTIAPPSVPSAGAYSA
jgi:hypothetical protein